MNATKQSVHEGELPDVAVPSHRTALGAQLAATAIPIRHPVRRVALATASACVAVFILTLAYPTWAKDLARFVKMGQRTVSGSDGAIYQQQTYRVEGSSGVGSTQIRANADGEIIAHSQQTSVDPALQSMRDEAEGAVVAGRAQLFLEDSGMRFYHVTLADGRLVTYVQGPGTNWSISQ